jgi:hypothetical protein
MLSFFVGVRACTVDIITGLSDGLTGCLILCLCLAIFRGLPAQAFMSSSALVLVAPVPGRSGRWSLCRFGACRAQSLQCSESPAISYPAVVRQNLAIGLSKTRPLLVFLFLLFCFFVFLAPPAVYRSSAWSLIACLIDFSPSITNPFSMFCMSGSSVCALVRLFRAQALLAPSYFAAQSPVGFGSAR